MCDIKFSNKNKKNTVNKNNSNREENKFLNNNNEDEDEELPFEDLAPDGGWGWMIALAFVITYLTTYSASMCISIVFAEFLESTGQSSSSITVLNSIYMISYAFSGVFTKPLLLKFPLRLVSIGAAVLFSISNISSSLVMHVYQLAISFFIQGIGAGIMYTICCANFNAFFVKHRAKAMSAAHVIIGLGNIFYPLLTERLMAEFGFRGTAALTGAISLNTIAAMVMMHPVEWHFKNRRQVKELVNLTHNDSRQKESSKLIIKKKIKTIKATSLVGQIEGDLNLIDTLSYLFEFSLYKDRAFMIICFGIGFVYMSDYTFSSILPLAMRHSGFTISDAALTITVASIAELASRILYFIFSIFFNIRAKIIFFYAMILMGFSKYGFLSFGTTHTGNLISIVMIGIVRSFLFVSQPLVVVENYPVEKYAVCYSVFSLISGVILVVVGPLVGVLIDMTNSYDIGQIALIVLNCIFVIPWATELIIDCRKKKEKKNAFI